MASRLSFLFLSLVLGMSPVYAADHFLQRHNGTTQTLLPCYGWTAGCSPTSASMALGYWDHEGLDGASGGKHVQWGKINEYYVDQTAMESLTASGGSGHYEWYYTNFAPSRPRLIYDVAICMGTDLDGGTYYSQVHAGIVQALSDRGYGYAGGSQVEGGSGNDWGWDALTKGIDSDAPVVWSISSSEEGHSVCAWGYTDSKEVIIYSTWSSQRQDWYYRYYADDPTDPVVYSTVDLVKPALTGTSPDDVLLIAPNGGEQWAPGTTHDIVWQQFGSVISKVVLEYSTDGGISWSSISTGASSVEDLNAYAWAIPSGAVVGSRARVRLRAYNGADQYLAADGSKLNFSIDSGTNTTPTPSPVPTVEAVVIMTPTPTMTPTSTLSPTPIPVDSLPDPDGAYLYPQPAGDKADVVYVLKKSATVRVEIYSFSGKRLATFKDQKGAGKCRTHLDFSDFESGLYLYVVMAEESGGKTRRIAVGKFILKKGS